MGGDRETSRRSDGRSKHSDSGMASRMRLMDPPPPCLVVSSSPTSPADVAGASASSSATPESAVPSPLVPIEPPPSIGTSASGTEGQRTGDDWKIQKRIVNFFHVEGRHTGENLSYTLCSSLVKWYVEKKMFSVTLDNASANEVAVKDLIVELKKHSNLICDGLFFHVRCAHHILNLVVKDGMRVISAATSKIRAFIVAIKGSTQQWEEFLKCATECRLDTKASLSLDVATSLHLVPVVVLLIHIVVALILTWSKHWF
ncbi:hypothetical protein ACP70R_042416 [Stipagrostis hirtigluma subsp. patula]